MELDSIHKFLTTIGVQRLTECLRVVPQTELYKPCPSLQSYVRSVVPWIQKQLYSEFTDTYSFLVESGIKARLAVMRFAEVCSCCKIMIIIIIIIIILITLHFDSYLESLDADWIASLEKSERPAFFSSACLLQYNDLIRCFCRMASLMTFRTSSHFSRFYPFCF